MKITFNGYTYFDPTNKDKNTYEGTNNKYVNYAFNQDIFNKFIADRRYQDAADYAAKFHFDDPKIQQEHENDIYNLRREGRKIEAIYSKIDNNDTLEQISFFENVFLNGGLEQIPNNSYAQKFIEFKKELGSSKKKNTIGYSNEIDQEATALAITFQPEKQKFLGIDWLAKDNTTRSIENFYATSGLNEAQLKSAGVEIIRKDGKTTLKFDKSNPYANEIIYNTIPATSKSEYDIHIAGYTADGTKIQKNSWDEITNSVSWQSMRNIIDDAKATKDKTFQQLDMTTKDYSSTIGPAIDDGLVELNNMLAQGAINESQYKSMLKTRYSYIEESIKALGSGGFEMYSNAFNEKETDETLISLDSEQRSDLISMISAADPKSLHFNAMVSNGLIGTLVTIDADRLAAQDINDSSTPDDIAKTRRWQVFIPGLFQKEAQAKINRNTTTRAAQEINSMQDYGYGFKCSDGIEIYSDSDGKFYKNGKEILRQNAEREINKTMIIEDATNQLQFQYLNYKGELYDQQGYEEMARMMAIKAANELYPEIPLVDENNKPLTVDDIFKRKGAGPTMSEAYANNVQFDV